MLNTWVPVNGILVFTLPDGQRICLKQYKRNHYVIDAPETVKFSQEEGYLEKENPSGSNNDNDSL